MDVDFYRRAFNNKQIKIKRRKESWQQKKQLTKKQQRRRQKTAVT